MKQLGIFIILAVTLTACGKAPTSTKSGSNINFNNIGGNNNSGNGGTTCTMVAATGLTVRITIPLGFNPTAQGPAFLITATANGAMRTLQYVPDSSTMALSFIDFETPPGSYSVMFTYNGQVVGQVQNIPIRMDSSGCHSEANYLDYVVTNGQLIKSGQTY